MTTGFFSRWKGFFAAHPGLMGYGLAGVLGAVVCHLLYDLRVFLDPWWGLDAPNDWMQHITGYYAFRSSPWGLPLLHTDRLAWPEGVSVFFTDSIPLLALPFKVIAPLLGEDFHYIKLWVLLAFVLQGLAAVYLIRALGFRDVKAAFFAAGFALLVKWLAFRVTHPALTGQFVILLALALYAQQVRGEDARRLAWKWTGLLILTFLIHLYLFVMVLGIFAAAVLDGRAAGGARISRWLYQANLLLLAGLLFPVLYGLLNGAGWVSDVPAAQGYGYFSLNLAGPLMGGRLLPSPWGLEPTAGQAYEDQSYLGLGVMGLVLIGAWLERRQLLAHRRLARHLRRSPFLALLCLGLITFALSTEVYWGRTLVFEYPVQLAARIQASPLSQFRASARFFWPVGYLLIFFGLAAVLRRRWAWPVLAVLLAAQWIDLPKPYTPRPPGYAAAYNADLPYWDALLDGKRALYLYPTLGCGGAENGATVPLLMMAAKNGAASNTVFASRQEENCAARLAAARADTSPGSVHVFDTTVEQPQMAEVLASLAPDWCAARAELTVCVPWPGEADRDLLARLSELVLQEHSVLELP